MSGFLTEVSSALTPPIKSEQEQVFPTTGPTYHSASGTLPDWHSVLGLYRSVNAVTAGLLDVAAAGEVGIVVPNVTGCLWGLWTAEIRTEPLLQLAAGPLTASGEIVGNTVLLRPRLMPGEGFPGFDLAYSRTGETMQAEDAQANVLRDALRNLDERGVQVAVKIARGRVCYVDGTKGCVYRLNRGVVVEFEGAPRSRPCVRAVSLLAVAD